MSASTTRTGYTYSACVDCYCAAAGVPIEPEPERTPLGLVAGLEAVPGCLDCDRCEHPDCGPAPLCECGYADPGHGFSWSPCWLCGSTLGGNRYAVTVWEVTA